MELSSSNIKKFLMFSRKKAFLIFRKTKTPKKGNYILGSRTFLYFRKLLIFQEETFRSQKLQKKKHSEKTSCILGNGTFYPQV